MAKTTENIARAAQRRASITAYLNQNPQSWLTANELGAALDMTPKEAAYTGTDLADQGLCRRALNVEGRGIYASLSANPDSLPEGATPAKGALKLVDTTKKRKSRKGVPLGPRKPQADAPQPKLTQTGDVELSLGGVLIVVGRNPATGRIRITLE